MNFVEGLELLAGVIVIAFAFAGYGQFLDWLSRLPYEVHGKVRVRDWRKGA